MYRILVFLLLTASLTSCSTQQATFWSADSDPVLIGKRITEDLLSRPDFMMYVSDHATSVHYAEVCAAFGAARLAGLLKDTITLARLERRYRRVLDDSVINTANHVDANVYGILPLELYRQAGYEPFLQQGMALADGQWEDPLPDGLTNQTRYWIDDVWMIGSLQVQAYRTTGEKVYLDRASTTISAYLDRLQQPNGLFHHGENAPFFWGRGNGWVAAGLAELLTVLPEGHSHYATVRDGYVKMMEALLDYQADNGMWRQLIDYDTAWYETSCTAMFGYAIHTGVKKGLLPAEKFTSVYQKAWLALSTYVDEKGLIRDVCVGTGKSNDPQYYLGRPTVTGDFHGQAPVLWFAYSLLQDN